MAKTTSKALGHKAFPFYILVFLVPPLILYTIFMVIPLFDSLRLSLYLTLPDGTEVFNGFGNFVKLFTNDLWAPRFWGALKNNLIFFAFHTFVQNTMGLLLAVLLTRPNLKMRGFYRTVLFLPTMLSYVIVGFAWKLIISPVWGVAEGILSVFGLQQFLQPWLGMEGPALVVISLISVWQFTGIPMMLFYAALITIPNELIEAAYVDGANSWQTFWRIKLPLILPTLGVVEILTFIGNFNSFDLTYVMQGATGTPNYSTDLLGTFFFRTFAGHGTNLANPTMGTAIATVMFIIILAGVLLYLFGWQRRVTSYEL
jgi:raffinose/stachyose/melibiose transport system permease protein